MGTLLFQPTVFCEITLPVVAKLAGWKAQAVSARFSPFGSLEIQGLEAVNERKSRIAMDSAIIEFDPLRLLTGRPEVLRADFRFAMVDLEVESGRTAPEGPKVSLPFSLREASLELAEGRIRTDTGAWILQSARAAAEGWDGQTPREIRLDLGRLDWDGPAGQELATRTQASAKKNRMASGGDRWDVRFKTEVTRVMNFAPWSLISPCQLQLEGSAERNPNGGWQVRSLQAAWQGVGGARLAAQVNGTFGTEGNWDAEVSLAPADLQLAGLFLQPRGIQEVRGSLEGTIRLQGGPQKPLQAGVELSGRNFQLTASGNAAWPTQPAGLSLSCLGDWNEREGLLRGSKLSVRLIREGQPPDLEVTLDRPATWQLGQKPSGGASEPASIQWAVRGMELAAVVPLVANPKNLKLDGGKLSAQGQATIEGPKISLAGRLESRTMTAAGSWLQGKIALQSASVDFQGYAMGGTQAHLEKADLQVSWEGGKEKDLAFTAKAEWDWSKGGGFLAGDLTAGLAGLGQAWEGAKFWPEEGQAQAHVEFSGNPIEKGSGLISVTLSGMRWPGETAAAWGAKISSELMAEQGQWNLPEAVLQAERSGQPLLSAKIGASWNPPLDQIQAKVELSRAESSFLVPLLKIFTPEWQWTAASGSGSFAFSRKGSHDFVEADLEAAVAVETGTPERPRPVDFSSVAGNVRASWPSGTEGEMAIEALALVAKHRDGTEAVHASLDAPLLLKKRGKGKWQPTGNQASSAVVKFAGWPMGIVAPLLLTEVQESSIAGTLSGFAKVVSDPRLGTLAAELDLASPDLSVQLPRFRVPENQAKLKADVSLGSDGTLVVRKMAAASQQNGVNWLELSAEKTSAESLAVVGKVDLGILGRNAPEWSNTLGAGQLSLRAAAGEFTNGSRRIQLEAQAQDCTVSWPAIGTMTGIQADLQGTVDWGEKELVGFENVQLAVNGPVGKMEVRQLGYQKGEAVNWASANVSEGWVSLLSQPWLKPNRWVGGNLFLAKGRWQPSDHGSSGTLTAVLEGGRISDQKTRTAFSAELSGDWEYDSRTHLFALKEGKLVFPEFKDKPVTVSSLQAGPGLFQAKVTGGVLDLRGFLAQGAAWQSAAQTPGPPMRIDVSAFLEKLVLPEARVGPVKIERFRYGPEGVLLEPSSVEVQGGVIRGSIQPSGTDRVLQAKLFVENFPLGAILSPMIQDARGPLGGFAELQFTGQATGAKPEDLQRSLTGQGRFRLFQAHLENLPAIAKSMRGAGQFLGSNFIANSEINDLAGSFQVAGTRVTTQDLRASGTALAAGLRGWLDWMSQTIEFQMNLALTREAIQSSGQLQGVMTQLVGNSTDYYTKIPGSATITGTLADPKVQMDVGKMLAEGGINLLMNAPMGILQGAGGAAGGATGAAGDAAGQILKSLPLPFFGR